MTQKVCGVVSLQFLLFVSVHCTGWTLGVCEERVVVCKMDTRWLVPDVYYSLLIQENFK